MIRKETNCQRGGKKIWMACGTPGRLTGPVASGRTARIRLLISNSITSHKNRDTPAYILFIYRHTVFLPMRPDSLIQNNFQTSIFHFKIQSHQPTKSKSHQSCPSPTNQVPPSPTNQVPPSPTKQVPPTKSHQTSPSPTDQVPPAKSHQPSPTKSHQPSPTIKVPPAKSINSVV